MQIAIRSEDFKEKEAARREVRTRALRLEIVFVANRSLVGNGDMIAFKKVASQAN